MSDNKQFPPVSEMSAAAVDVTPTDYDWSEYGTSGIGDEFEYWEACSCETGGTVNEECDVCGSYPEGPMMNYYYELPGFGLDPERAAGDIRDLSLCIVELGRGETYALALTGGGMDLSWEICEAFMRLDYLPPTHFARLPIMAGLKLDAQHTWIIEGMRASLKVQQGWLSSKLDELNRVAVNLANQSRGRQS